MIRERYKYVSWQARGLNTPPGYTTDGMLLLKSKSLSCEKRCKMQQISSLSLGEVSEELRAFFYNETSQLRTKHDKTFKTNKCMFHVRVQDPKGCFIPLTSYFYAPSPQDYAWRRSPTALCASHFNLDPKNQEFSDDF